MGGEDRIEPDVRRTLEQLGEQAQVEVLVYPAGATTELVAYLADARDRGELQFNVIELAGFIALRAARDVIGHVAARGDVSRVALNPRFTADGRT